jgi:hypothetical protein
MPGKKKSTQKEAELQRLMGEIKKLHGEVEFYKQSGPTISRALRELAKKHGVKSFKVHYNVSNG